MTAKTPLKVHLRLRFGKREKAPHCGALWLRGAQLRAPLFILCFNRTAISIQKIDSKSSKSHLKSLPRISPKSYRHRLYLKPFLIAIFNFSHKRPTFAFTSESGHTLGPRRKIAHKGTHGETGAFPPSTTVRLCVASELLFIPPRFYIHTFPGSL